MKHKNFFLTGIAILGLAITTMAQMLPPYLPAVGLKAWYPFTGNANDQSGNGLNGSVSGAVLTTDRFGNTNCSYRFSTNQQIEVPNTENQNVYPITISLWYSVDSLSALENSNVFTKYTPGSWNGYGLSLAGHVDLGLGFGVYPFYLRSQSDRLIGLYNEPEWQQSNISVNTWYHYVCTVDDNGGKIYVNGRLISSHSWTGTPGPSANEDLWKIGGRWGNSTWYQGKIDDIGIWNRVLTEDEITDLFTADICYQVVTVTDTLVINANITGYNPIQYAITIKIFPNPSSDMVTIDCGDFSSLIGYKMKIFSSSGQMTYESNINRQRYFLDLNTWGGKGLYFFHLIDANGNTVDIKKIVLQ